MRPSINYLTVRLLPLFFLLLLSEPKKSYSCSCFAITRKEAICGSQWSKCYWCTVSLVNIVRKKTNLSDHRFIEYEVEHLKIFKSTIGEELSSKVQTPKFSASCGVSDLKVDRQYLLAGNFGDGKELLIFSCGAIPAQDGGFNPPPGVLEWDRVPKKLRGDLLSQDFPNCTRT